MQGKQRKAMWGGGLIFVGVGCALFGMGGWSVMKVEKRLGWAQTIAIVTSASLEEHISRDADDRSETTSYKAKATFDYLWEGQAYTGDDIDSGLGADNLGSYQYEVYSLLKAALDSGEPVKCLVNSDKPEKAVLFNWVRPGMVAFFVFSGVVFGAIGAALLGGPIGMIAGGTVALGSVGFLAAKMGGFPDEAVYGAFSDWLKTALYTPSVCVIAIGFIWLYKVASKPPDDCVL